MQRKITNRIFFVLLLPTVLLFEACSLPSWAQWGSSEKEKPYKYPSIRYGVITHLDVKMLSKPKNERSWYEFDWFTDEKYLYRVEVLSNHGRSYAGRLVDEKASNGMQRGDYVRISVRDGKILSIKLMERKTYDRFLH